MKQKVLSRIKNWLDNYEIMYPPKRVPFENDYKYLGAEFLHLLKDPSLYNKPQYIWGALQAASLGKALKYERISFVEFGVAAGNGLKVLDKLATIIGKEIGIKIEVHGFDTGVGMPKPTDYRDLPNLFSEGEYNMDFKKLSRELNNSTLHIGLVEETIKGFILSDHAPIAFCSFDLDYYSSTKQALEIFNVENDKILPRTFCYVDDIFIRSYCEWNGPNLAINEYNQKADNKKLGKINGLRFFLPIDRNWAWPEATYYNHIFDHPRYNDREFVHVTH